MLENQVERAQEQRVPGEVPEMLVTQVQHPTLLGQAACHRHVRATIGLRNPPRADLGHQQQHEQAQPHARSPIDRQHRALETERPCAAVCSGDGVADHELSVIRLPSSGSAHWGRVFWFPPTNPQHQFRSRSGDKVPASGGCKPAARHCCAVFGRQLSRTMRYAEPLTSGESTSCSPFVKKPRPADRPYFAWPPQFSHWRPSPRPHSLSGGATSTKSNWPRSRPSTQSTNIGFRCATANGCSPRSTSPRTTATSTRSC